MDLTIRPLEKRDIETVKYIFDLSWKDEFRNNLADKLKRYFNNDPILDAQKFKFFVAEDNGEVVGVDAIRDLPDHMKQYASTENPAEWYVVAAKEIGKGIGSALMNHKMVLAKNTDYTEIVLFSGETHQDSWKFHDTHFERVGPARVPNGEAGYVWRRILD